MNQATPIKFEDILKGDRIRHTFEYTAIVDGVSGCTYDGDLYELIERPVTLPTEPGVYAYKCGDMAVLHRNGQWICIGDGSLSWIMTEQDVQDFAPFTLLRPVAEVAAEVLLDVRSYYFTDDPTYWEKMAAVTAKWATK